MKNRNIAPLLDEIIGTRNVGRESNPLHCVHNASGNKCSLMASVEAVHTRLIDGIQMTRILKLCGPHATKFAITAVGHVRFDKIPFPTFKEK